ncbi:MAG: DUF1566 domain-containing protein [Desulfobacterales bacterium]|jgi:hypothetical protein
MPSAVRWIVLLALVALVPAFSPAAADRIFYSVQFAVFQDLASVNRQVNALQDRGKLVFWEQTTMPGAGTFYRVYLGRFDRWDQAVAYAERLKRSGALDTYGIHWFTEPEPEASGPLPEIGGRVRLLPLKAAAPLPEKRFQDNGDGTITDAATGLMWPKNGWRLDLLSALPWEEAVERIAAFRLAGHGDWRMPSLEEWLSLIDEKNRNPALVSPNPFVNIISHMPYWSATEYTYHAEGGQPPLECYTVMLYTGTVNHQKKSELAFVMPVRPVAGR